MDHVFYSNAHQTIGLYFHGTVVTIYFVVINELASNKDEVMCLISHSFS